MINKLTIKNLQGFTLIETLLAVLLLATAIAGPLTIASKGLSAALVAKDQISAFYLAQDAMEQVRFIRDSNTLGGGDWLTGAGAASGIDLTPCVSADGNAACQLDSLGVFPAAPTACPGGICEFMRYDSGNNSFNYHNAATAPYTPQRYLRTISIKTPACNAGGGVCNTEEAVVTIQVTWSDLAGVTHMAIRVRENLLKWQ